MPPADHLPLLKRAGLVLLLIGLLDVVVMIYAIATGVSYSSSLNIFAVFAGIFLLRGSLRTAAIVRWFSLFFAAALLSVVVMAPLSLPLGLLATHVQVNPLAFLGSICIALLALAFFMWLARLLSSPAVKVARANARRPAGSPLVAVVPGVVLVVVLTVINFVVQHSESADRAIAEARHQLGDDYDFYVSSLHYGSTGEGKLVSGVVTAWKSGTIKDLRFQWRE